MIRATLRARSGFFAVFPVRSGPRLFDRHALRQAPWSVDLAASHNCHQGVIFAEVLVTARGRRPVEATTAAHGGNDDDPQAKPPPFFT